MDSVVNNNIQDSSIEIHNDPSLSFLHLNDEEYFGILRLKMKKTEITKQPTLLHFTIDKSGSMNDCSSGTKKIEYVIQTFVNMVNYFANLEKEIYIQVNTFCDNVNTLVDCVQITKENVNEIINKICNIKPDGSTNIEAALKNANKVMVDYFDKFPHHQVGHIFMTDGDPTHGETSHTSLSSYVNESFPNIFVGFGEYHNVSLLRKLSDKKLADYQFVDNMEHTGLIYGEVIHQFMYPALQHVELRIRDGELYDWRNNIWTTKLFEPVITSETEKIYHIKTTDPKNVAVEICSSSELLDTAISIPDLIDMETGEILKNDLTKYAYRQKVQELLFSAKDERNFRGTEKANFKMHLRDTFDNIRKYMRENELMEDGLLKMLCDDISIVYKTLNSNFTDIGNVGRIALARHSSQGRQQAYNLTPTSSGRDTSTFVPPHTPRPNRLQRMHTANIYAPTQPEDPDYDESISNRNPMLSLRIPSDDDINEDTFEKYIRSGLVDIETQVTVFRTLSEESIEGRSSEDSIENYIPSNNSTTCFATPSAIQTMREVSQTYSDGSTTDFKFPNMK
jgi:uncharacterized protein YegL